MSKDKVYPWSQIASGLAAADGFDWSPIDSNGESKATLSRGVKDDDEQPIKSTSLFVSDGLPINIYSPPNEATKKEWEVTPEDQRAMKTQIATEMWGDIIAGNLLVRAANGEPMTDDPKFFKPIGATRPHLTANEGNDWLKKNRYLEVWKPETDQPQAEQVDSPTRESSKATNLTGSWKIKIQVEATARFNAQRKFGASPTVHSMVDDMAKWCRDNDLTFMNPGRRPG
jgi:hypothetical protein